MFNKKFFGIILALSCVLAWGLTFVSTKVLLVELNPVEILFLRIVIAYIVMWLIYPKALKFKSWKKELYYFLAGCTGITLYYILENVALNITYASNVSIIVSTAPLFIVLAFKILRLEEEKLSKGYYIGFLLAITGIVIMSGYTMNIKGDFLALLSALMWALYSIFMKECLSSNDNLIQVTRRVFFYGIITTLLTFIFFDFSIGVEIFKPKVFLNLLFLSFIASAFAFIAWNAAIKILGATSSAAFIYLNPVITLIASYIILDEKITVFSILGIALVILGLYLAEKK